MTCGTACLRLSPVPLVQRSVVAVHGRDAFKYLQGMITNDLANLADVTRSAEGGSTLYTMMLNSQVCGVSVICVYWGEGQSRCY